MMRSALSVLFVLIAAPLFAQEASKYRVHLSDKEGVSFRPRSYFSDAAIERRELHGIPLDRPSDRPLKASYVERVRNIAGPILFKSRWFNMVYVRMSTAEREDVAALDFVEKVEAVRGGSKLASASDRGRRDEGSGERNPLRRGQVKSLGVDEFRDHGLRGDGVRIAVLDNGFDAVKSNPVFRHLFEDERIIKTRDFVQDEADVYDDGTHGRMVLSCIAGLTKEGKPLGLAPKAEFLLARTERTLWEPFSEEENWLAAVEWADREGARIINSSLGYTHHRYFPKDMDGSSYVARAANMAARKGILVVTSAGNAGADEWKVIGTPADADSALTIGGVGPGTGTHISFSSFGPAADGDMKPNLCAYGRTRVANGSRGLSTSQGTSFSSPLVAGFAACALQSDSSMRTMEFFEELERSGHLYPYHDLAHGYGMPQASYFTDGPEESDPSFEVEKGRDSIMARIRPEAMPETEAEEKAEKKVGGVPEPFYYHIADASGRVKEYAVLRVEQREVFRKARSIIEGKKTLRLHYKGHTRTIE